MICDLPKWWIFLTYDGFKSHVNVAEGIYFSEDKIKVGDKKAGKIALNQDYDKIKERKEKDQIMRLLDLARRKVHGCITHWKLIVIIYISIKTFLPNYGQITLLLSTFILITFIFF